jgi:hypothetical protein
MFTQEFDSAEQLDAFLRWTTEFMNPAGDSCIAFELIYGETAMSDMAQLVANGMPPPAPSRRS